MDLREVVIGELAHLVLKEKVQPRACSLRCLTKTAFLFVRPPGGNRVKDEVQHLAEAHFSAMFSAAPAEHSDTSWVVPHEAVRFIGFQLVDNRRAAEEQEMPGQLHASVRKRETPRVAQHLNGEKTSNDKNARKKTLLY